jgi:carbon-monoxide dehydrogenase large subunit
VCTVEIDLETGGVKFLRYIVVEDCGRVINPAVVEGQIRGGVAQGIGEVLYEWAAYDEDGNFLASTFMDYLLPTAAEIPVIEIEHMETDPEGEFGFRGVGEGGAIVAPATLTNAIEDALLPFGARVTEQYLPPAKVLELAGVVR